MSDPFGPHEDLNIYFRRQVDSGCLVETGHSVVEEALGAVVGCPHPA